MPPSARWLYLVLWSLAVKHRSDALPSYYDAAALRDRAAMDARTCSQGITKLQAVGLIGSTPEGGLLIHGAGSKHPKLKNWEGSEPSPHGADTVAKGQGEGREKRVEGRGKSVEPPNPQGGDGVTVDCEKFKEDWNLMASELGLSEIATLTKHRRSKLIIRLKEGMDLTTLQPKIRASAFLMGKTGWKATFDWIVRNAENWVKVLEGNYDNKIDNVSGKPIETTIKLEDYPDVFRFRGELIAIANKCKDRSLAKDAIHARYREIHKLEDGGMPGQSDSLLLGMTNHCIGDKQKP